MIDDDDQGGPAPSVATNAVADIVALALLTLVVANLLSFCSRYAP